MQLLKILLVLLLLFFPTGELIRINLGNNAYLKPLDIFAILILFTTAFLYIKEKKFEQSLMWYYFLFPIVGFISLLINSYWLKQTELLVSFLYLFRWVSYLSVFLAVVQVDSKFKRKIIKLLFYDGALVILIGFLQFFFYPKLQSLYYLGWDNHFYRLFSSFLDPNFVGAFFVLYLIFISGFRFIKDKSKTENTNDQVFKTLLIIFTLVAIFLTYSRSALLMLAICGILFFIMLKKKKFILYLFVIIVVFIILASPFFYLENINLFRSYQEASRIVDIQKGLTIFRDHPLIGVGFDSYRYAQFRYHFENPIQTNPVHSASGTDNSFVFILATTGIIGFVCYLFMWYQLGKSAWKKKSRYSVIFSVSIIGIFFNSFFNNSLFYAELMIWIWFIAGLTFEKD